ncbi:DUF1987 domain-containing protein [Rapidithrix thailandica]|uniref:DUF1987 domain-containing protein n=1 Tax=Rapidithrix thailandica TaxID=413964 RepID=A0AAW9S6S3_9BACT
MKDFYVASTNKTPEIKFQAKRGELIIAGRSVPENSTQFYRPVYQWLDHYIHRPAHKTTLKVNLEYFNTSSSKCLVDIFRKLEQVQAIGRLVQIVWHYEKDDEDMLESGEDFQEIIKVPIHMKAVKG